LEKVEKYYESKNFVKEKNLINNLIQVIKVYFFEKIIDA
jgi:hypothetical protein